MERSHPGQGDPPPIRRHPIPTSTNLRAAQPWPPDQGDPLPATSHPTTATRLRPSRELPSHGHRIRAIHRLATSDSTTRGSACAGLSTDSTPRPRGSTTNLNPRPRGSTTNYTPRPRGSPADSSPRSRGSTAYFSPRPRGSTTTTTTTTESPSRYQRRPNHMTHIAPFLGQLEAPFRYPNCTRLICTRLTCTQQPVPLQETLSAR